MPCTDYFDKIGNQPSLESWIQLGFFMRVFSSFYLLCNIEKRGVDRKAKDTVLVQSPKIYTYVLMVNS